MIKDHTFPEQQPGEQIILFLRRHWFVFFIDVLRVVGLAVIPIVIFHFWTATFQPELAADSLGYIGLVLSGSLYYIFLWVLLYDYWLDFDLDFFVVTDKRVVDVEQSGLFNRTVAAENINRVQDVTSEVKGFFPTMLRYGNVYVQTAGAKHRFVFKQVSHPETVVSQLLKLVDHTEIDRPQTSATGVS